MYRPGSSSAGRRPCLGNRAVRGALNLGHVSTNGHGAFKMGGGGRSSGQNPTAEKGKPGVSQGRKARGLAAGEMARLPVLTMEGVYAMKQFLFRRLARMAGLSGVILILGAGAAAGPAMAANKFAVATGGLSSATNTSACVAPALIQPFLSIGDSSLYALAPGESADSFSGTGWILTGGARIITTTLADGATGSVLDLPSGSSATSPQMCVTSVYPTARTLVRDVVGSAGVKVGVSYTGGGVHPAGQVDGQGSAWTASDTVNVNPSSQPGGQLARVVFVAGG
jgi:hypothetical protein